jgi:membrane fusion protein, multidrug efflux system
MAVATPDAPPRPPDALTRRRRRRWLLIGALIVVAGLAAWWLVPLAVTSVTTISTDDAFVAGHATLVAPRVGGQVTRVLVEDTQMVHAGDVLVELDRKPFQVQYDLRAAVVSQARADLQAAEAGARASEATARARRWQLQQAIEQVHNQVALIRARVAGLRSQEAIRERARADLVRAESLKRTQAIAEEEVDLRRQAFRVAEAQVLEAQQQVSQARVGLGLPAQPAEGAALDDVPKDIDQTFSGVRVALAELVQIAAQLGLPLPGSDETPQHYLDRFYKNPEGEPIEQILERIVNNAPPVRTARAKLAQAEQDLEHARLDLTYTEVRAPIDGVISRRSVNPGNTVQAGQQLMAVQSLTDVWVEANFKETQLAELRIGQPVDLYVDTYGDRVRFHGRVAGFAPGTGSTLALLPPENATGNFVKVVQRLPVRIELTEPPPADAPLFVGLSVTPYVRFRETPTGPNAGRKLQLPVLVIREPAPLPPVSPPSPAGPVPAPAGPPAPPARGPGGGP